MTGVVLKREGVGRNVVDGTDETASPSIISGKGSVSDADLRRNLKVESAKWKVFWGSSLAFRLL